MIDVELAKKNREVDPDSWEQLYEDLIERKIRLKYSVNQELAILRQRDKKPKEFKAYDTYVEACKTAVKEEMGA
jgi:hypothetical protein